MPRCLKLDFFGGAGNVIVHDAYNVVFRQSIVQKTSWYTRAHRFSSHMVSGRQESTLSSCPTFRSYLSVQISSMQLTTHDSFKPSSAARRALLKSASSSGSSMMRQATISPSPLPRLSHMSNGRPSSRSSPTLSLVTEVQRPLLYKNQQHR